MEVTSSRTDVEVASSPPVIDSVWFDGLHQTALSCFTQSRVEMECIAKEVGASNVPWTISSTATILTSDVDAQRKVILDYIANSNGIKPLLELLESSPHTKVGEKTVKIIRELVSPKSGKHRTVILKQCLDVNYLAVAVSVLKQLLKGSGFSGSGTTATASSSTASSSSPITLSLEDFSGTGSSSSSTAFRGGNSNNTIATPDDLGNGMQTTMDLLWFLSSAVAKDSHFPDKVRQMLKVKFFHDVFKKVFFAKSATHFPLLKIMRQLSKSKCRNTSEILGKDKVMHTVKKCFAVLNNQPHAKLLILFEWLALLTRDRKNCIRFLKAGMLVKVLNCFRHWQHWKGKGLLKLSKSVISIYTHLARTKSGKKSLVQSDAISMIRAFCEACPQERSFDDVIMRSCAMIHVCYGKETLPLERLECPIKFEVPRTSDILSNSPLLLADSGSSSDEDDPEAEGDDEGSDSDIESESDNSLVDEDEDDQDQADTTPVLENRRPSRKGSLARNDSSSEVESEMMSLDRIAKFSYFFREFSSQYTPEVEGKKSGMSIVNKLEQSSGDCIIEEYEESWTDLRSDDNGNLEEASGGTSNNIPHVLSFPTAAHKYSWTSRHGAKLPRMESLRKLYFRLANKTSHVSPFVKIAYPDICFGLSGKQVENLCATTDRTVLRKKMFNCIAKAVAETVSFRSKIVYSLDELIGKESMSDSQLGKASKLALGNNDEADAGKFDSKSPLSFESRFESGNLRKAVQTGDYEYDLFLTSDINSSRHNQWFYFQVGNVSDEASYTFNIINCIKTNSLFNYGMQPVVFSVMDAMKHKPGWVRSGSQLCYYKNGYKFTGKKSTRTYHTLSFTLSFANKGDIVYIAYYIPFTYTRLMVEVHNLLSTVKHSDKVHCRYDVLCKSLDHNDIPLLTITAPIGGNHSRMQDRDVVFITSRVHPGETNASWVMMGILRKLLLGNNVEDLLQRHVFKIVPMLNAEGVINGCHRSGLTSQDLNRCWMTPHEILHPSIYNTKMLIAYCCRVRGKEPSVFLDLHGHSRRKNAFFYGCSFARSWRQEDRITPENPQKLYALAESMSVHCPYFVMHFCHYDVRKSRETTARVAVWREFGITRSFTLECSYCGCDRGPSKGVSFGTSQLWEIGEALCESIATMECKIQSQQKLNEIDVPEAVIESFIE